MGSNKKLLLILGVLSALFITGLVIYFIISIFRSPYLDRDIAGSITLSDQWLEIAPTDALKPERRIHEIVLNFSEPLEPDYKVWGVRLKDGSVVIPEVQLIDQDGNTYKLTTSSLDRMGMSFSMRDDQSHREILPTDRTYRAVRIRCEKLLRCSSVIWRCYNPWDR